MAKEARGTALARVKQWMAGAPAAKQLPPSYGFRSYMVSAGQPVWMDRDYAQFAQEAYIRNVVAFRAVNMIADAACSVEWKLSLANASGQRREAKNHPLLAMLNQPNPQQNLQSFLHAAYHYQLISGNMFTLAVGPSGQPPMELHLLRPDAVAVIAGKYGIPAGYRYTAGGQSSDYPVDRLSGRSRMLHLKRFHPLNDWYGLSPIEAAAYSIDQHNQAGAWNQALMQNGARPSGALVVKVDGTQRGTLSDEQYRRIKQQVDEEFSGPVNAGRPLLLEGGLDWKEMSLSPKDMDFIESKNSSARDIALAFGVPPQLLGIPGDNTYSNLQEARLSLWEQTVMPLVKTTASGFGNWLAGFYPGQLQLVPDFDSVSALAGRNQAIWDRLERASFLTDDEKRAALGYAPRKLEA